MENFKQLTAEEIERNLNSYKDNLETYFQQLKPQITQRLYSFLQKETMQGCSTFSSADFSFLYPDKCDRLLASKISSHIHNIMFSLKFSLSGRDIWYFSPAGRLPIITEVYF
jgi:hypothetical protein